MDAVAGILQEMAAKSRELAAQNMREGDYYGEDGLIYCGKCNTPKEYRPDAFPELAFLGACRCEQARRTAEDEQELRRRTEYERQVRTHELRTACFSDDFYRKMSFDSDNGCSPKAASAAHYYADNFERFVSENKGLMLLGTVGTGKTFAACCIANALVEKGWRVWTITAGDIIRAAGNFTTSEETFNKICGVDLLIIDDFGTQSNSDHNLGLLFDVIDKRYKSAKPLIITSNLTVEDFRSVADTRLKRIYDRVIEMCSCPVSPVVLSGSSLRSEISRRKHKMHI